MYPDSFTTVPEKTKTDTVAKHGSNASDGTVVCDHESHARTGQTDMAHGRAHAHGLCRTDYRRHHTGQCSVDTVSLTIPRTSLRLCISLGADLSRNAEGRLPRTRAVVSTCMQRRGSSTPTRLVSAKEELTTSAPSWPGGVR